MFYEKKQQDTRTFHVSHTNMNSKDKPVNESSLTLGSVHRINRPETAWQPYARQTIDVQGAWEQGRLYNDLSSSRGEAWGKKEPKGGSLLQMQEP